LFILFCALALTVTYPVLVQLVARIRTAFEWRSVLLGYLGLFLMGAAYLAIGLFISALTENQMIRGDRHLRGAC